MPRLDETEPLQKKFKKKQYRPWNLLDDDLSIPTDSASLNENTTSTTEKSDKLIDTQLDLKLVLKTDDNKILKAPADALLPRTTSRLGTPNPLAKREQTVSNTLAEPLAKREQTVSNNVPKHPIETTHALAEPLAEPLAKREQTVSNALANTHIEKLVGKEKEFLIFIFKKCQINGSLESPPVTTEELKNLLNIKAEHQRNLIHRLCKKGFLYVSEIKNGRFGWRKFKLNNETFHRLTLYESVSRPLAKREQTVSNTLAEPLAEPLATPISSSSYIKVNTTTSDNKGLPDEWENIDISPLQEIHFSKTQLLQLYEKKLTVPEVVQESINHFAFGLKNNPKVQGYNDPLNVLMGVLRTGKSWVESNYAPPYMQALKEQIERKKAEQQEKDRLEKDLMLLHFDEWFKKLSEEEKRKILPEKVYGPQEAYFRDFYEKSIWSSRSRAG